MGPGRKPRKPVFSERGSNRHGTKDFFILIFFDKFLHGVVWELNGHRENTLEIP